MRRRIFTVWLRVVNGLGGCGARLILDLKKGNANAGFGRLDCAGGVSCLLLDHGRAEPAGTPAVRETPASLSRISMMRSLALPSQ